MSKRIDINELWAATDGGKPVILHYYPQAFAGFSGRKNFRMRPDDKNPSASVFRESQGGGKFWYIQDKGGSDTKARNAVTLVMENEGLSYGEAIRWIASCFAPHLLDDNSAAAPVRQPAISKAPIPLDERQVTKRPGGLFTEAELETLGYKIKQENCNDLSLLPLDAHISPQNEKGESWVFSSTPDYPIYYFDYSTFGKIYQPYDEKLRFLYVGTKPANYIFGDTKVARLLADARNNKFPEVDTGCNVDERMEDLVICSGPSDALNVSAAGYHVCWLNSETAELDGHSYYLLKKIAKTIYIVYDLDTTGKRNAYRIALKYLDIRLIWLPDDLSRFRDRKGKPCKDAKDFFCKYRTAKWQDPYKHFDALVTKSKSLKFWMEKYTEKGEFKGYDIDNAQLYGFLQANGIYKIETNTNLKGFTFCSIKDNIVTRIDENKITPYINDCLIEYINDNTEYYDKTLENTIHRSNQVKLASLEKLKYIYPDFKSFDRDFDFFFFRNTALRITKEGVTPYKLEQVGKYVYDFKIIDHDFTLLDPPFDISHQPDYAKLLDEYNALDPHAPKKRELKERLDGWREEDKYKLNLYDMDFSFMKFTYNTGRVFWRKEEGGHTLNDEEKREQDLYFISKVCALGYLLFRYKEKGQAYYVYAMETEQGLEGEHLGGTGKSILMNCVEHCRSRFFVDGQRPDMQKSEHLFGGVERGVTEIVVFDDLDKNIDLHRFLNVITGPMEVRALYKNTEILPFSESPKVCGASNHSIRNLDASLRRRIWFLALCNYYHPEDRAKGWAERSPFTEFGKNLITDYTPEEMNRFYNFMAWCLHTYLKFRRRIQPPMEAIDRRNIQRAISDEFIWWADDWFTEDRLNATIDKNEAFDAYKLTMPEHIAKNIKMKTFTTRLGMYCQYMGWIYNPADMLKTDGERKRGDIRVYKEGKDIYCFHIRTAGASFPAPAPSNKEEDETIFEQLTEQPPF